jgi:uncharacterized BrkB/YihY/UPF0761 family membrane protein
MSALPHWRPSVVNVHDVERPATRRRLTESVKGARATALARLEYERERRYLVALAYIIAGRGRQAAASVLAGALAFRFFLTLLPLTLVAVVGLGYLKTDGGTPSDVVKQFGIKGALASTINDSSALHNPGRTAVLVLGVWGVFTGARTCTATLRAIHALAWGVPVVRWRRRSLAGMLFLGAVLVGFALGGLATDLRSESGVAVGLGAAVAIAAIASTMWLGASYLLPHRNGVRWTSLVPGAVVVGVGFAALQAVTANWIGPKLDHESSLYGSLGVSFVVLGWLYAVGRLLVAAPLLNVSLLDHRQTWAKRAQGGLQKGADGSERETGGSELGADAPTEHDAPPSPNPELSGRSARRRTEG